MNLKEIEQTNLNAVEVAYIGSFIKDKAYVRNMDFHAQRTTIFKSAEYADPLTREIAEAINRIHQDNEIPTIKNVVASLIESETIGAVTVAQQIESAEQLEKLVDFYASRGAVQIKDFRKRERIMDEARRVKLLSPENLQKVFSEISLHHAGAIDKATALKQYVDDIIGGSEFAIKTTNWEEQKKLLQELPEQFANTLNKPRFTFPMHWGLNGFIPQLRPGEKCVLSGGTGDGKSALAMQFAEWSCIVGKNVLVIHMEDSDETILMRQTLRWVGGTLGELERGDPDGKMDKMIKLREWWNSRGGSLTYKYLAGNSIGLIIDQIKETSATLEAQDKHLDVVVMDYFQKVDFDSEVKNGQNYVNVATQGAERLKIIAERLGLFMFVVSQETPDNNGGKHTAWSRALEQKPQIYISLTRQEIKKTEDEEVIQMGTDPATGLKLTWPLAKVGDRSCWMQVQIKKANQGKQGMKYLFFDGPRFRAFEPAFMIGVEDGRIDEFEVPMLKPVDADFRKRQAEQAEAYRQGYRTLRSPDQKGEE